MRIPACFCQRALRGPRGVVLEVELELVMPNLLSDEDALSPWREVKERSIAWMMLGGATPRLSRRL